MTDSYDVSANLKELLSRKPDDAKKPEALPQGTYFGVISRFKFDAHPFFKDEGDVPLLGAQLYIQLQGGEDAVMEELREHGTDVSKKFLPYFMEFRRDGSRDWSNKEFLNSCGIETSGRSFAESIPDLVGKRVIVEVLRVNNKKTGEWINNTGKVKGSTD